MKNEPRIPTLIGIVILLLGMGSAIFLIEKGTSLFSQATPKTTPREVTVANVNDNLFSVSWLTDSPTYSVVEYKEQNPLSNSRLAYDIRDRENSASMRYTHFVTIEKLRPETEYQVKILAGKQSTHELTVKTGPILTPPISSVDPAFGTVLDHRNTPANDVLVHASFEGSQVLASLTNTNGEWVIPLGSLRSADNNRYFTPKKSDLEHFFFVGKSGSSIVTTTIDNDSPLSLIRLGESYDLVPTQTFRSGPIIAQAQSFQQISGSVNNDFRISAPLQNSFIPSYKPAFKGFGVAGKQVVLTISEKPTPISTTITIATNNTWVWTPNQNLSPGKHVVTATSFSSTGQTVSEARSFTVLKSGTSVLGDATPSASLSPTPSPSALASASPTASATPRLASATPSASATTSGTPVSGTWKPTAILLFLGLILLLLGVKGYLFKTSS